MNNYNDIMEDLDNKSDIQKRLLSNYRFIFQEDFQNLCCTNISFRSQIYSVVVKTTSKNSGLP